MTRKRKRKMVRYRHNKKGRGLENQEDNYIRNILNRNVPKARSMLATREGCNRIVGFLFRTKRLEQLLVLTPAPTDIILYLYVDWEYATEVYRVLSKVSPACHAFLTHWALLRQHIADKTLFPEEEKGAHLRTVGEGESALKVAVKIDPITKPWVRVCVEGEKAFSVAGVALGLLNLSPSMLEFSFTTVYDEKPAAIKWKSGDITQFMGGKMVHVASFGGTAASSSLSRSMIGPFVIQAMCADYTLRTVAGVYHNDFHLGNLTWKKRDGWINGTNLVFAWGFDNRDMALVSHQTSIIEGISLPRCFFAVTLIDGGMCSPVSYDRAKLVKRLEFPSVIAGIADIDMTQDPFNIGVDFTQNINAHVVYKSDKEGGKSGKRAILYYTDIPNEYVDIVSLFFCLWCKFPGDPNLITMMGHLALAIVDDPELSFDTFVCLLVEASCLFDGVEMCSRSRGESDYVVPLSEPTTELRQMVYDTCQSLRKV